MRWVDLLRRTDVRAALAIAGVLVVAITIQGILLAAFVAQESLEEADRWMSHTLASLRPPLERGEPVARIVGDMQASLEDARPAARLRDASGEVVATWGPWPATELLVPTRAGEDQRRLDAIRWMTREHHLVGNLPLPSGERLEIALPLAHFVTEAGEVAGGIALITLASGLLALLLAVVATARAFSPLREATAELRRVDAQHLGRRLPTRGTADPVDRHAETLNQVLSKIDDAHSRLRDFSSNAAHELRTPLNRMGNVAEVALLEGGEAGLRNALESVHATVQRLTRVVDSLLLLAEIDDQRLVPRRTPIDAAAWVARTADVYGPLFEERDVKLHARCEQAVLQGDAMLLDRVLTNLLENALRHTPPGGRVEVIGERCDDRYCLRVEDTGPGVAPRDRERIFDRFSHLEPGRGSSGLGLALARAIARLHRGEITVGTSEALGGAAFLWWLPVAS